MKAPITNLYDAVDDPQEGMTAAALITVTLLLVALCGVVGLVLYVSQRTLA